MKRVEALKTLLGEHQLDGLIVLGLPNRQYVTQFTGTAGAAIITENAALFITDFRYKDQAKEQVKGYDIIIQTGSIYEEIAKQVERLGVKKLGFEQSLTYGEYLLLAKMVKSATLIPTEGLIEKLRLKKDPDEIKIIQEAANIADAAFEHILSFIGPGVTERSIANELEFFMRREGATSSSFDTIVASGYRSALPHGVASDKVIEKGELVTLDYGAYYKGYCSDITRTVAVGQISDELKAIYETVLGAQLCGMNGIKAGMTGKEADALTRDYITEKGYGAYFGHSTGHGVGMEIHEAPTLSMKSETILEQGMVVTVEPGIYITGIGGTRIEDDILILAEGNRSFTHATKELILL